MVDITPEHRATRSIPSGTPSQKAPCRSQIRQTIAGVQKSHEQVVDIVSQDEVTASGFSQDAKDKALALTKEFEQYLGAHKDEIEALQILYNRPYRSRLTYKKVSDLAEAIRKPHPAWTTETLWRAYEALDLPRSRLERARPDQHRLAGEVRHR